MTSRPSQSPFVAPSKSFFPPRTGPGQRLKASPVNSARHAGPTFRERFCAAQGLPLADYETELLRHSLYPHARWLRAGLEWWTPDFFRLDRDFIQSVGGLRRRRDFALEAEVFHYAGQRSDWAWRVLRLRVSAERVRALLDRHWITE